MTTGRFKSHDDVHVTRARLVSAIPASSDEPSATAKLRHEPHLRVLEARPASRDDRELARGRAADHCAAPRAQACRNRSFDVRRQAALDRSAPALVPELLPDFRNRPDTVWPERLGRSLLHGRRDRCRHPAGRWRPAARATGDPTTAAADRAEGSSLAQRQQRNQSVAVAILVDIHRLRRREHPSLSITIPIPTMRRFDGNGEAGYENCVSLSGDDICGFASQRGIGWLGGCGDCRAQEAARADGGKARQIAVADCSQHLLRRQRPMPKPRPIPTSRLSTQMASFPSRLRSAAGSHVIPRRPNLHSVRLFPGAG
jgi:hypothetical protein